MAKVLGMGNALVDIITRIDGDHYLQRFDLPKGSMTLVDRVRSGRLLKGTGHLERRMASGGSAANTIHGMANLGMETAFIGKIGRDKMGKVFRDDLVKSRIEPKLLFSKTESGRAISLVSPDTERTMATYLGAAIEMSEKDLSDEQFRDYDHFHVEGYLVQNHAFLKRALELAKKNNMSVSIDMASYNVVEANKDFLLSVIKDYVDIVFANEEEARAFTGKPPEEALESIAESCEIAVVKLGRNGSLIKQKDRFHRIGIITVKSIDTTGAGDLYASGFLYGHLQNMPLEKCGEIGAILAGKVIEVIGPKMDPERWKEIRRIIAGM